MSDRPELRWVPVKDLYVDKAYQRTTESSASKKNIKSMVNDFQWALCGAITVCWMPKTKKYAIIDGQHRFVAAKACGAEEMPCMVISGYEVQGQARNFLTINQSRVNMTPISLFHAAVAAGDADAASLKKVLDTCKVTVSIIPRGDTGPRETNAVGTLLNMTKAYNEKHVKLALTIIPEAYGEAKGAMRAMLLKALAEFSQRNPQVDRARLAAVLRGLDPKKMESDVRASVKIQGGNNLAIMVEMLEKLYKKAEKAA